MLGVKKQVENLQNESSMVREEGNMKSKVHQFTLLFSADRIGIEFIGGAWIQEGNIDMLAQLSGYKEGYGTKMEWPED